MRDMLLIGITALALVAIGAVLLIRAAEDVALQAPSRATVHYVEAYGIPFCSCAPMRDGCYTAKHCFTFAPPLSALTVDGVPVPGYSLDPDRDLAHIPLWADPSIELGAPQNGDARWYGMRRGPARLLGRGKTMGPYSWRSGIRIQRQTYDAWCYGRNDLPTLPGIPRLQLGEDRIRPGDSGGGFFQGNKLVGILSLYDGGGCAAWTVSVP